MPALAHSLLFRILLWCYFPFLLGLCTAMVGAAAYLLSHVFCVPLAVFLIGLIGLMAHIFMGRPVDRTRGYRNR
jgi:hypothetical protein